MPRRFSGRFALAALLLASPLAAEIQMIAFGDSVTQGYGDTCTRGPGYAPRLERQLNNRGDNVSIFVSGVGGETTAEGLSRVDAVLDLGGDYFLLMEGTNDVSHRVSPETVWSNLDEMAVHAELRGMTAVHATVIPRKPTAVYDSDNTHTADLAATILANAPVAHRAVVDPFDDFLSIPGVFDNFYLVDDTDPVGHPNCFGYDELGGLWVQTMIPLVEAPQIAILPPPQPIPTGVEVSFSVSGAASFAAASWSFGDGGVAIRSAPSFGARYVYAQPGTYTVTLVLTAGDGTPATATTTVVVAGAAPAWATRQALLPVVIESPAGDATKIEADLVVHNSGSQPLLAEIAFYGEVEYDAPPGLRKVAVDAHASESIANLLPSAYGLAAGRGSLVVTYKALSTSTVNAASSEIDFHLATGGSTTVLPEVTSTRWTNAEERIGGITGSSAASAVISIADLDLSGGFVRLDIEDGVGTTIGSSVIALDAGTVSLRSVIDQFRGLASALQPFTIVLRGSAIRFAGALVIAEPPATISVFSGTP